MKIKAKDILNGWTNYLVGSDNVVLEEAKRRADICSKCPELKHGFHTAILPDYQIREIQGHYCNVCKCPSSASVRSKNHQCPLGYW